MSRFDCAPGDGTPDEAVLAHRLQDEADVGALGNERERGNEAFDAFCARCGRHHRWRRFGNDHYRRGPAALLMEPLSPLLDDLVRRRDENEARYAAFKEAHGAQNIGDLSRDETRELFSILLAVHRLAFEWTILARLVRGMKR
jgi:hypothetical protein